MDYVYNLAGQLKAINHPELTQAKDPGKDATDLFGMVIDYYDGDYKRDPNFSFANFGVDQFNGNIKGITWNTKKEASITPPSQYMYQYNKSNWLTDAIFNPKAKIGGIAQHVDLNAVITKNIEVKATKSITLSAGFKVGLGVTFKAGIASSGVDNDYTVSDIIYDANGNIQTLNRNKNTENGKNEMDKLRYQYKADKPNQLQRVDDLVTAPTNANDLKDQVTKNNYLYNAIGQLIENKDEKVKYEYNASGLVTKVFYNNKLKVHFFYNDKGFRVKKNSM